MLVVEHSSVAGLSARAYNVFLLYVIGTAVATIRTKYCQEKDVTRVITTGDVDFDTAAILAAVVNHAYRVIDHRNVFSALPSVGFYYSNKYRMETLQNREEVPKSIQKNFSSKGDDFREPF